jgi:DNA-binding NarL/FixJ family response regulator
LKSPTRKITVLLVDDHALVRRGFRRLLEDEADISVVGEAGDGVAAVQMARELKPKVVIMDFAMPGMNGVDATRKILKTSPKPAVLMLSMHSENTSMRRAAEVGARGYVLKNAMNLDLGSAIRKVAAGELLFDHHSQESGRKSSRDLKLSARELQVLQLIVDGNSNKEIAARLSLSGNTVGAHRTNIMRELGVRKAAELVAYAIRNRLVNIL